MTAADLILALSDATRLRIARLLAREGPLCVCELCAALALEQPKVSRHLARLRDAGLVGCARRAQWVVYALTPGLEAIVRGVLDAACALGEPGPDDAARLAVAPRPAIPDRPRAPRLTGARPLVGERRCLT